MPHISLKERRFSSMRAALYLRVSTNGQTTENQERDLRSAAERFGHVVAEVYTDHGIPVLRVEINAPHSIGCGKTLLAVRLIS